MLGRSLVKCKKSVLLFLSAIVCCVVLYAGYCAYLLLEGGHQLRKAIDEADRLDPGWRLADLEQSRAVISDDENSALQVLKADGLIPDEWWEAEEKERENATGQTSQSSLMVKNALVEARKLAAYEKGRFSIGPKLRDSTGRVAWLLACDVQNLTKQRKTNEAMISGRAILAVARSIGDEPSMFSQMFRVRSRNWAVRLIERTLADGEASEEILRELQDKLQSEESEPLSLTMARAERALCHERLQTCENGDQSMEEVFGYSPLPEFELPFLSRPLLPHSHAWIIRYFNNLVEACKGPAEKQKETIQTLSISVTSASSQVRWILSDWPKFYLRQVHRVLASRGLLRCAATALACERFRLRNNRWPRGLEELVPDYLQEIPCDPIHGTTVQARMLEEKMIICFPNLKDNSNRSAVPEDVGNGKEIEVSFTLWSPSERKKLSSLRDGRTNRSE